ncbi:MAG: glycoside hydrolase family 16 protein [Algibacter sp.]|uniref:glycoside hydrolase family 16 protein n=1 Tax=Algibacter sp. TaxID=1872428 RepID=UPI0026033285|nr:glycoside hydrolase family 16 protein [Algibacter sp.]MDG1730512.1 glycoside hydrolase family 16 protein [Algibacter sp.]MDG2179734.1 glycoside hydrolase family 16 protein [Algibacter sp.]
MNKTKTYKIKEKTLLFMSFLLVAVLVIYSCETDEKQTVTTFNVLVMADEFDVDGVPNPAIWGYDTGTGFDGWGNNELQSYTDRSKNVSVQNGMLLITAQKEDFQNATFTSARLSTKGLFEQQYGRFEARIKVPSGSGLWPAFWLLGADCEDVGEQLDSNWPLCGEIDIMEYRRDEPTSISGTVHGPGYSGLTLPQGQITKSYDLEERIDNGFHIFGIEWGPDYINFYVDDVLYNQITPADLNVTPANLTGELGEWVFNKPYYIILNLAVGGAFPGNPDSDEIFPQSMLVDYVRVYKRSNN